METNGASINYNQTNLVAELAMRAAVSRIPPIVDNKRLLVKRDTWLGQTGQRVYDPLSLSASLRLTGDDGDRTLDTARVRKMDWLSVGAIRTHGANIPTEADLGIGKVLRFSDAPVNFECCTAKIKVPSDIDLTVQPILLIGWSTSDNNGLDCRWQLGYLWRTENEDMSAAAEGTITDDYTDTVVVNGLNMTQVQLDDLAVGDVCLTIQLCRRSDNAGDTLNAIDVDLHGICLYYIADKLGEAL